jgi:hypothetical protein
MKIKLWYERYLKKSSKKENYLTIETLLSLWGQLDALDKELYLRYRPAVDNVLASNKAGGGTIVRAGSVYCLHEILPCA